MYFTSTESLPKEPLSSQAITSIVLSPLSRTTSVSIREFCTVMRLEMPFMVRSAVREPPSTRALTR